MAPETGRHPTSRRSELRSLSIIYCNSLMTLAPERRARLRMSGLRNGILAGIA
jgi:hypothetical protein